MCYSCMTYTNLQCWGKIRAMGADSDTYLSKGFTTLPQSVLQATHSLN